MLERSCFNLPFSIFVDLIKSYKGHLKTIEIRPLFETSMKSAKSLFTSYCEIGR